MKCLSRWLFAVAVAVVLCTGMWGCGDTYYNWEKGRSAERVVGFVDDSLVMVGSVRCWNKYEESVLSISDEDLGSGCGHTQLCVYNYRVQEDGPRWCDSLDNTNDNSTLMGQLSDSVIWGGDPKSEVSFWKIGEKPHKMKLKKNVDGCSTEFKITSIKQWLDGRFIARGDESLNAGGGSCQYAVLDTVKKTLTYKRLDEDLKWIEMCDDVRAWGEDVYCLFYDVHSANVYLKIDNKVKDSMVVENQSWYSGAFFEGHLMLVDGNLCDYRDSWVCYPRQGILKIGFHAENGIILSF